MSIDLRKSLKEFYKKQAEITKRLEEREVKNNPGDAHA